jgi:phosphoribosylaminoimidazole-succinocarboxamide synthase
VAALGVATPKELTYLAEEALKINQILKASLIERDVKLVDFKLEFGRLGGEILLADEISPDTCRFWDAKTSEKLDKDRFRRDLGQVAEAYREIYDRLVPKEKSSAKNALKAGAAGESQLSGGSAIDPALLAKKTYKAKVEVRLKDSVLDPQGEAVLKALKSLGHEEFIAVRVGKLVELTLTGQSEEKVLDLVELLADELLANPVMENFVASAWLKS